MATGMVEFTKKNSVRDAAPAKKGRGGLSLHRRKVKRVIFERSGGLCEICRWQMGTDYHHVYGRGKNNRDWREQSYASLLVCRTCHPHGYVHERSDEGSTVAELALFDVLSGKRNPWEGFVING